MVKKIVFLLFLYTLSVYSAVNYPYPQRMLYGHGTINTTVANASTTLKNKFTSFLSTHYEENSNKTMARIKFDNTQYTVSEGIAYGMIMMVYFSDNETSYQTHFDRLWAYYKNYRNGNGLMHWKINGFNSIDSYGAASDAEFDAALALVMAYYQFGDQTYLNDAKDLIARIRQYEINGNNNLHRPGDADGFETPRNPSYVSPAAFEIFKEIETSQASKWSQIISANYTLLKSNQNNSSAGLPSDWCNDNGSPNGSRTEGRTEFGYDASRAPWRWAWSNAWYGHADAKTLLNKLATWVNGKTPASIKGPIKLNGEFSGYSNSTFLGPLTSVLSYSSEYQTKMNTFWSSLIVKNDNLYFSKAMQILTGLLATGNMPNLKALSEGTCCADCCIPMPPPSTPIAKTPGTFGDAARVIANGISLQVNNGAVLEIFNLRGEAVKTLHLSDGIYSVPLGDLPKGLYIAKIKFGSERKVLRIPVN